MMAQGTDVDACYDTTYWTNFLAAYPDTRGQYDSNYDIRHYRYLIRSQAEALRADMCGWRMVAKRGYIGALQTATKTMLQVNLHFNLTSLLAAKYAADSA
jgi:hypothetical protein